MRRSEFKLFSLFSGAGGMDLGFAHHGGFSLFFANDIRRAASETYSLNFKHPVYDISALDSGPVSLPAFILGDVDQINFEAVKKDDVDVVVGGPPCQDFSIVRGPQNERKGIEVKRGRLYAQFVRALIHLQPKVFVFENVPGLKSANKGAAYKTILDDFSKLNLRWSDIAKLVGNSYSKALKNYTAIFSDIVDSADIGVPQKRRRLIIIGVREDLIPKSLGAMSTIKERVEALLLGKESLFRKYPLTSLEVFEGLPLPELNQEYAQVMKDYKEIVTYVGTQAASDWKKQVWDKLSFDCIKDYLMINNVRPKTKSELNEAFEEHTAVLKALGFYKNRLEERKFADSSDALAEESKSVTERLSMIPPDENHEFVRGTQWEVEGKGMSLIYRRLHPLKPSNTVVAFGGGGTWGYHYSRSRGRLTNRERARLQSFPDSFFFKGSCAEVRAQIGEAVPPLLGKKIAEAVEMILNSICDGVIKCQQVAYS